jgi:hypothetical protein
VILLLLVLAGCGGSDECVDAACRVDAVKTRWDGTVDSVRAPLAALADPMEQELVVLSLAEGGLGDVAGLCALLGSGEGRSRCEARTARPHLNARHRAGRKATVRPGGGPSAIDVLPDVEGDPRFAQAAPIAVDCGAEAEVACRSRNAQLAAQAGDGPRAAGLCAGISAHTERAECHFRAAEQRLAGLDAGALVEATELCLQAGSFLTACLGHQARAWADPVPPATSTLAAAWAPVLAHGEALHTYWAPRDAAFAEFEAMRFWSEVTNHAFADLPEISGDLLDLLPAEAAPHIRAAAAWRYVELHPEQGLAEAAQGLQIALDRRLGGQEGPRSVFTLGALDLWPRDAKGEELVPAVIYRATSRRALDADPAIDQVICLLEAAIRQQPQRRAFVEEGLQHSAPVVQSTATRLLKAPPHGGRGKAPSGPRP